MRLRNPFRRLFAAGAMAFFAWCWGSSMPPSDRALVAEFRTRRAKFDTLLAMFRADSGLGRVADDFTRPASFFSGRKARSADSISAVRLQTYRRLFHELSLEGGIEGYDDKRVVYFWRYSSGMGAGLGGSSKGFAFSDSLPPDKSAASGCNAPRHNCWQFRPIADGWFILEEDHN